MGRSITIFPRFSQRENQTTNYCLLVLKMLYEENPKLLGEALGALLGPDVGNKVGVVFQQQERKLHSVPDGLIVQAPISIYIETKNFDWFSDSQLERHLEALDRESPGTKVLLALSRFDEGQDRRFESITAICAEKYRTSIVFQSASFQEFLEAIQLEHLPKNIADTFEEFRAFLDGENLLSSWESFLDVVNCAQRSQEILDEHVYLCPATGGSYSHGRCKYFGMYRNKAVECVALIRAVVDVEDDEAATIRWKNVREANDSLIAQAREKVQRLRPNDFPKRVFLLDKPALTDFKKDTPGGMQTSKQYFNITALKAADSNELAAKLSHLTWSGLRA